MQFESLEIFCDVARNRSFSQAAAVNDVTQSAVSQMVAQLENRLKVQLIDRSTRPLQLTALGKVYYEGCRALLEQYRELEASLRSAQARVEGTVQVAAIYSVGLGNMNQYVEEFIAGQPEAEVHIEYLHPDQVYEKVQDGSVDLGLVSFPRKSSKLTIIPWRNEAMVCVCAPGHPLATESSVRVAQLGGQRYVHFSKELVIRREVDRFLRGKKVSVDVVLEFDNIENIKQAVELDAGIALLPEPTLRREVASGSLIALPLADAELVRPLGIIYRRHHKLSQAAQGFLDLLCRRNGNHAPDHSEGGTFAGGTEHRPGTSRNGTSRHTKNHKKKRS
jgi:DNA-binding transcriptional LysR family regulator